MPARHPTSFCLRASRLARSSPCAWLLIASGGLWRGAHVELSYVRDDQSERILRRLRFEGALTEEQRARLAEIAEKTPVTLTLRRGLPITTELDPPLAASTHAGEVDARLDEALDESLPASDSPRINP